MRRSRIFAPAMLAATATGALFAAQPAAAQDAEAAAPLAAEENIAEVAEGLRDPAMQQLAIGVLGAMIEGLMEMPAAPLIEAVDRADGTLDDPVDPDTTLADLAGPDAAEIPARLSEELPAAMETAADMSESLTAMLPVLRQMAERLAEVGEAARR